jgi:hypothetical protein
MVPGVDRRWAGHSFKEARVCETTFLSQQSTTWALTVAGRQSCLELATMNIRVVLREQGSEAVLMSMPPRAPEPAREGSEVGRRPLRVHAGIQPRDRQGRFVPLAGLATAVPGSPVAMCQCATAVAPAPSNRVLRSWADGLLRWRAARDWETEVVQWHCPECEDTDFGLAPDAQDDFEFGPYEGWDPYGPEGDVW